VTETATLTGTIVHVKRTHRPARWPLSYRYSVFFIINYSIFLAHFCVCAFVWILWIFFYCDKIDENRLWKTEVNTFRDHGDWPLTLECRAGSATPQKFRSASNSKQKRNNKKTLSLSL